MQEVTNIKAILLGDAAVGKTSLRRTYMGESFKQNYLMTIGADFSTKNVSFMGKTVRFQLWDIAGQQSNREIVGKHCAGAGGAIIVYSRNEPNTVEALEEWINIYFKNSGFRGRDNPVLILGNKSDLIYDPDFINDREHERILDEVRSKFPNSTILGMTTSALTGENVDIAFSFFGEICYEWLEKEMSRSETAEPILQSGDYKQNFPLATLFTINKYIGPVWISSYPEVSNLDKEKVEPAMVDMVSNLDVSTVDTQQMLEGNVDWPDPSCTLVFVCFGVANKMAPGGYEHFVLGIGVDNEILGKRDTMFNEVSGILQATVNELITTNAVLSLDLYKESLIDNIPDLSVEEIKDLLWNMRKKAQDIIFGV